MSQSDKIRIGLLTTGNADRPHYPNLQKLLPHEVSLIFGGLGLVGRSESDLTGKSAEVVKRATEFARSFAPQGIIISGAPLATSNPGLENTVSQALGLPVVTPLSAATTALRAFSVKNLILMTPFDDIINTKLKKHLKDKDLEVIACPVFEDQTPDAATKIISDELLMRVRFLFMQAPAADAIYFQGASLDPIPIIQRLEDELRVPVIASNPAMIWCLLSRLGYNYSIHGFGKLLALWPPFKN